MADGGSTLYAITNQSFWFPIYFLPEILGQILYFESSRKLNLKCTNYFGREGVVSKGKHADTRTVYFALILHLHPFGFFRCQVLSCSGLLGFRVF